MLLNVPPEIIFTIIRSLDRDVEALRNAALVCHALLPAVREELFKVMNARALVHPYMRPFLDLVVELQIGHRPKWLDFSFVANLQLEPLRKLKAIRFICPQPLFYRKVPPELYTVLASRASVTELILYRAVFRNLAHAQTLICALPNLSHLSMQKVNFIDLGFLGYAAPLSTDSQAIAAVASERPRLARLSVVPSTLSMATSSIIAWLAQGPSAQSLRTLVVPYKSAAVHLVLENFGDTVEDLRMPVSELDNGVYSGYLERYTKLRTLTVFLGAYSTSQGPWFLLAPFFERGIFAKHLHTIVIDVRVEYPMQALSSAVDWAALDRVNDELDEEKFEALQKVVFIIQWSEKLAWTPEGEQKEMVRTQIEQRLYNLDDAGKLDVRVQVVKKFYDSICREDMN